MTVNVQGTEAGAGGRRSPGERPRPRIAAREWQLRRRIRRPRLPAHTAHGNFSSAHAHLSSQAPLYPPRTDQASYAPSGMASTSTSGSSSSSRLTQVGDELPRNDSDASELPPKFTPLHSLELQEADVLPSATAPRPLGRRLQRAFLLDHPRVRRIWLYFRGPRPKVDLPGTLTLHDGALRDGTLPLYAQPPPHSSA